MSASTFIDTADNYQYIFRPLTHIRKEKFKRIVSQIDGGDVLDLGCGQTGHYWALGYAHKVDSIAFYDVVEENINEQIVNIENLSPDFIDENFQNTLDFLKAEEIIPEDMTSRDIAENIISKTADIRTFDFSNDRTDDTFDIILAMESVEIADNYEQFVATLKNVRSMLRPGGKFIGLILPYGDLLPSTQEQINIRREGRLNPGMEMTLRGFSDAGLRMDKVETYATMQQNYEEAICFYASRGDT